MASSNDNKQRPRIGILKKLASAVQNNMDDIYRSTYYSDPSNASDHESIKSDTMFTIKQLMDNNADNITQPNISRVYERLFFNAQNDSDVVKQFERIFGDNEWINTLSTVNMENKYIKAIDTEVDQIIKYMPKMQEALDTIRDNVLSSDSFNKDYLNIESDLTATKESEEQFAKNINDMKENYEILKLISRIYDECSKYGEIFIYAVPYTKAIQKLIDNKNDINKNITVKTNFESGVVIESATSEFESETIPINESNNSVKNISDFDLNLNIEVSTSGIISSIIESEMNARKKRQAVREQSLTESYFAEQSAIREDVVLNGDGKSSPISHTMDNDLEMGAKLPVHHNFDHTIDDDMKLPSEKDTTADGLYTKKNNSNKIKDMNGCIVKVLDREKVTPIILNDINLGYYYFEYDDEYELFDERYTTTGMVNTITGLRSNGRSEAFDSMQRREELLKSIANSLAEKIDASFVNANQDLKKEIYYILKYNESFHSTLGSTNNVKVSYIPPDDIHHIYFKLDNKTNRGISDLALSLVPAKLWVAIYITNCLAIMTRGNDKRVYYVKQSVESNISKTLLKTINEIKKSNFGIRQIENINSVLNITGRFNDYIIPRGSDGQSPIEFEVMQGQQVEIKTELLNLLEESAINIIGVPIEIIQNRQSPDYAMQLTMSNSKFLRFVYTRQGEFQKAVTPLLTKIYNIEYGSNERLKIMLPPPLFINVTNTNQLILNTNDCCESITNIIMADETNEVIKTKFAKELKIYHLGTYLNMDMIRQIENKARQSATHDIISNPDMIEQ